MSFFGYLASGLAEGAGRGIAQEADYMERRNAALELAREKAAATAALDRQRAEDRADRERDNILLRAQVSGQQGGGGGRGINLFQLAMDTPPEKQGQLVETVRAFQGDDAANVIARLYGRPEGGAVREVNPTAGDFARFDRGQTDVLPETTRQPMGTDVEKGRLGLQRLMALVSDPAKLKSYADGEAQILRNDVGALTVGQALRTTGADVDGLNEALTPLNPKAGLDQDKNSLTAERIAAQREAEEGKNRRNAANIDDRRARADGKDAAKRESDDRKLVNDRTAPKAARDEAAARLRKLEESRAQPAATSRTSTAPRSGTAASAYADWLSRTGR